MPVHKKKLIQLFAIIYWQSSVHMVANKDSMMRVLWCKEIKWRVKGIYVKKRVQKSNVGALFL